MIESYTTDQSLFGRVLNYGTIRPQGSGDVVFPALHGIIAPHSVHHALKRASLTTLSQDNVSDGGLKIQETLRLAQGLLKLPARHCEERQVLLPDGTRFVFIFCESGSLVMNVLDFDTNWSSLDSHGKEWYVGRPASVKLTGFWMSKYPITEKQWNAVLSHPSTNSMDSSQGGAVAPTEKPVIHCEWPRISEFLEKLSRMSSLPCRLPTDAEWEYACRAGTSTKYSFGDREDEIDAYVWHHGNTREGLDGPMPVGLLKPNPWGFHEMHGNVWEWCLDGQHNHLTRKHGWKDLLALFSSPNISPITVADPLTRFSEKMSRVMRGGSFVNGPTSMTSGGWWNFESRARRKDTPCSWSDVGFRIVVSDLHHDAE